MSHLSAAYSTLFDNLLCLVLFLYFMRHTVSTSFSAVILWSV